MKWYENKFLSKFFLVTTEWNIAWKLIREEQIYHILENPVGYWLADALLFEEKNIQYLFVEAYEIKEKIGRIGILTYNGNKFIDFKVIMKENYHLSYPYVFKHMDKIYMIPESCENASVDIYEAKKFPEKWEKIHTILKGCFVDTSVYQIDDKNFLLYTYNVRKKILYLYMLDFQSFKLNLISEYNDSDGILRNGGKIVLDEQEILRPVQFNNFIYGQYLRIVTYPDNILRYKIIPEKIDIDNKNKYRRLHTYSRTNVIEAIDLSNFKFDIFKVIRKLL